MRGSARDVARGSDSSQAPKRSVTSAARLRFSAAPEAFSEPRVGPHVSMMGDGNRLALTCTALSMFDPIEPASAHYVVDGRSALTACQSPLDRHSMLLSARLLRARTTLLRAHL